MQIRFCQTVPAILVGAIATLVSAQQPPAARSAADGRPRVTVLPTRPAPGSIVRFTVRSDSITQLSGTLAGEPLHFYPAGKGEWRAIGGVPVDASRSVTARVMVERHGGGLDTIRLALSVPALPRPRAEPLRVDTGFTAPPDSALEARIARENARAREIGQAAHQSPPLWSATFLRPRVTRITSPFGTGRVFNGAVTSRHLGVDFAGKTGGPVRAANRGVVALVDSFFLAGTVIYVDHGGGIVTGYFHLSKALVAVGDTVSRGQEIGLVGATGRVTASHLHWTARYGAITVNPLDLVRLGPNWYAGPTARPRTTP